VGAADCGIFNFSGVFGDDSTVEYCEAAKSLLKEEYSHLKKFAPEHLADPGNIVLACCEDGLVIRYERKSQSPGIISGWMEKDLPQVAALLSQNLIQCHTSRQFTSTVETTGTKIKLSATNQSESQTRDFLSVRIGYDVVLERPEHTPAPPHKPFCLSSVRNTLEIGLEGELVSKGGAFGDGQRFLARSRFRLPVGWDCIEIYPLIDLDAWKPEYARTWAENEEPNGVVSSFLTELQEKRTLIC